MEFRVLGPVRAMDGGTEVPVGPPMQRSLLALLLIHPDEVVSVDRIVDALWDEPPRSASKVVQVYVSGLRKVLEPDRGPGSPPQVLVTCPPGYMLRLGDGALDSTRFEELVLLANELESIAAEEVLQEAMSLWKGHPFDGVRYSEFAQPEIRRLEELHLQAEQLLNHTRLELGKHDLVLAVAEAQLKAHPFSEVLWKQFMLALYRAGRQTDALRAFRRARAAFADIGTEPPKELEELEERILIRDPTLDPIDADGGVRTDLPTYLSSFVGRSDELESIGDLITTNRLVTLVGAGGIGKTRLGVEVAAQYIGDGFDHVWFVELAGADPGEPIAPRIIASVGAPRFTGANTDFETLRRYLAHRRALLVVDNCEHLLPSASDLARDLLIGCPELRILATSRRPLGIDGELVVRIKPLPLDDGATVPSDATRLFLDRAKHADGTLDTGSLSSKLVNELLHATAGIPLAIELAASRLGTVTLEQLTGLVRDESDVLGISSDGDTERHGAMGAAVSWSYRLLGPKARARFRRLAVFRGGFTLEAAREFLTQIEKTDDNSIDLLTELVSTSLVTIESQDRYVLLEPIRQYALRVLEEHDELADARKAHAEVYRKMFHVPDSVLFYVHNSEMTAALETESDNLAAAVAWSLSESPSTAIEITSVAANFTKHTRSNSAALQWYRRALDTTGEVTPARARALTGAFFTAAYSEGVDSAQKFLDELAAVADALDDEQWRCAALARMSDLAAIRGDDELAYRLTIDAAERLDSLHHPETWVVFNNRSATLMATGSFDRAEMLIDRLDVAMLPHHLYPQRAFPQLYRSLIAAYRGDHQEAIRLLDRVDLMWWLEHDLISIDEHMIRGHVAVIDRHFDDAAAFAWELVRFARTYGDVHSLMEGLLLLGLVALHEDDRATAASHLMHGIRETQRLGHRWLQHELLAALIATVAPIDPTLGAQLLAAEEAQRHRERRALRAVVADVIGIADDEVSRRLKPSQLVVARRHGEEIRFEQAISLTCDVARSMTG